MATTEPAEVAPDYVEVFEDSAPIEIVAGADVDSGFLRELLLTLQARYDVQSLRADDHVRSYTVAPSSDSEDDAAVQEFLARTTQGGGSE